MPPIQKHCICGEELLLPANHDDVKCTACSRVFNHQGRFLWREGKDGRPMSGAESGEKRSDDQIAAAEQALEEGKDLTPKRAEDEEILAEIAATDESAGAATGDGADRGKAGTPTAEPDASAPASPPRGEHTHKHAKGAGHKPFTRGKK